MNFRSTDGGFYMYKELAVIMDGDKIHGFLLCDPKYGKLKGKVDIDTSFVIGGGIAQMDETMELAAQNEIDSLRVVEGKLMPAARKETVSEDVPEDIANKLKAWQENMTMEEFVGNDCIFQKKDVDIMLADKKVIMASVCQILDTDDKEKATLYVAFYSSYIYGANHLRGHLDDAGLYHGNSLGCKRDYGLFMIQHITLDNLLKFQETCPLNIIYNMDTFRTMRSRVESVVSICPPPLDAVLKCTIPKPDVVEYVRAALEEANRKTMEKRNAGRNDNA